jgi:integrase
MSSVKLRTTILKDGRQSLYLDIYYNGKNKHKYLKLYLEKPTSPEIKQLNEKILLTAEKLRITIQEQIINGTFGQKYINKEISFLTWFEELTEKRKKSGINYETWRSALKHLKKFLEDREVILVKNLTTPLLEDIKTYFLSKVSQNSSAAYFDIIKHSVHEAFRRKLILEDPALSVKSVKYSDPHREFLTEEEVKKLAETECNIPVLKKAFLFSCLTGLRFSDCEKLTWAEVQYSDNLGWFLRYRQKKTKGSETTPLSESAIKLLGPKLEDPTQKVFQGLAYTQCTKLEVWFTKAGITKKAHFHIARHTNACLLLQKGVDIYTVSKLLGHQDLKSTMIYAKIVDDQKRIAIDKLPKVSIS